MQSTAFFRFIATFALLKKGKMKTKIILTLLLGILCMAGCKNADKSAVSKRGYSNDEQRLVGDKTIYGLACEGCSDSVVVLLPNDGSDPITYDIIDARRNRQVLGKIKTGDWIGVVLNEQDSTVADLVVDLDQLKGIWCYIVMPKMRDFDKMSKRLQQRMMANMSDSLKETFLIPREYGFYLKRQWEAQSVGYVRESSSLAEESPVVYPPLGYFVAWHIWNGKLVITSGTPDWSKNNELTITNHVNDTCSIDYLGEDSLVLSDRDGSRSYYRKNDINDVNTKAKAIAEMRSKEALKSTTEN